MFIFSYPDLKKNMACKSEQLNTTINCCTRTRDVHPVIKFTWAPVINLGLVCFGWNGSEHGLFRPDQFGPIQSQVGLGIGVRLDTVRNEKWSIHVFLSPSRPGMETSCRMSGMKTDQVWVKHQDPLDLGQEEKHACFQHETTERGLNDLVIVLHRGNYVYFKIKGVHITLS